MIITGCLIHIIPEQAITAQDSLVMVYGLIHRKILLFKRCGEVISCIEIYLHSKAKDSLIQMLTKSRQFPTASSSCTASRMNAVSLWKEEKCIHFVVTTQIWMEIPTEHRTDVIRDNPSQSHLWTRPNPAGLALEVSAHQSEVRICIPACIVIKTYCKTVPGLNFITNSHCICWIYNALSKIWRDTRAQKHWHFQNTSST